MSKTVRDLEITYILGFVLHKLNITDIEGQDWAKFYKEYVTVKFRSISDLENQNNQKLEEE